MGLLRSRERKHIRRVLIARDGKNCGICGGFMNESQISIDHIIPICEGGANELVNLRLAHRYCNEERTWNEKTRLKMAVLSDEKRRKKFG